MTHPPAPAPAASRPDATSSVAPVTPSPIADHILRLTAARGADKSICPSEVARALMPEGKWQAMMPSIRRTAAALARAGLIDILRHGKPIDPDAIRGVIRLRRRTDPDMGDTGGAE